MNFTSNGGSFPSSCRVVVEAVCVDSFRWFTSGWLCVVEYFYRQRTPQTGLLDDGWCFQPVIARLTQITAGRAYYWLISSDWSGENQTWTSWSKASWTNNKSCSLLLSEGLKFCTYLLTTILKAFKAQIFLLPVCWWGIFWIFLNFKVKSPYLSGLVSQTFNWCLFYEFTD